jgi:membrane fusion protein, multidrug efflux system
VLRVVFLLLLVGAGAYWFIWLPRQQAAAPQNAARASGPVAVSVISAHREDMPIYLSALGTVQAANTVQIRPRVEGMLDSVAFTEGQMVKKGDVLAQIDPRVYRANLDQARAKLAQDKAQLESDRRDLERDQQLAERSFASKQQLDQRRAAVAKGEALVEADAAAVQSAQVQLDYTTITAPFDGRIGLRGVDAGNMVRTGGDAQPIATLTQHQPISVLFSLPENQLGQLRKAMQEGRGEVLAFDQDSERELATGRLQVVDNQIDPQTGTVRLKAEFANEDNALWPGQFVPVKIQIMVRDNIVALPSAAIQRGPDGLYVWVVGPEKKARMAPVKTGPVQDEKTVVESGITPGDRIIVGGQYRLQPNSAVQFEEPRVSATEPPVPPKAVTQ